MPTQRSKEMTGEKRRASLNSSANKTRTPAVQRLLNSSSRSNQKPLVSSGGVCRAINFAQTLKENNSKLSLNSRSPLASPNPRLNRPLSQVNSNQAANQAINIIKQHHANYRANILRSNIRGNLSTNLQRERRLNKDLNNIKINEDHLIKKTTAVIDELTPPSKLTTLLNSTNLLNEETQNSSNEKALNNNKKDSHQQTDLNNLAKDNRAHRASLNVRLNGRQSQQQSNEQQNKLNLINKQTNAKTPLKQSQQQYPNAVSPSLIKPPTAQLIRHENHTPNQDVFNYTNLNTFNNKYYDEEDHCISETHELRSSVNNKKSMQQKDKIYAEQTLSASCNRLSQVSSKNSSSNLPSVTAVASCSTPSLNNSLTNNNQILYPHSVIRNYEIGDLIGEGNFAVVHQVTHKRTRRKYALKIIDKRKCAGKEAMIDNEVTILKKIKHPNIVQLHEDLDYPNELYLFMELVNVSLKLILINQYFNSLTINDLSV